MKTYTELIKLPTFEERFLYLKIDGLVGEETFGYNRYLNQLFYHTKEWKKFRRDIILRDMGCDLGIEGRNILGSITIHHLEPITESDICARNQMLMDPENAICVSHNTHMAIHYGDMSLLLPTEFTERKEYDTCPWK